MCETMSGSEIMEQAVETPDENRAGRGGWDSRSQGSPSLK